MLQAGATGFVLKNSPSQEIVTAVTAIYNGGSYFTTSVAEILVHAKTGTPDSLTTREHDVLVLVTKGMTNKAIARHLDISVRTAETHRRNIKKKLDIDTTSGLVRYAIDNGIIC